MKSFIILSSWFAAGLSIALQEYDTALSNNLWTRDSGFYSTRKIFSRTTNPPRSGSPVVDRGRPQTQSPRRSRSAEPSQPRGSGDRTRTRSPSISISRSAEPADAGNAAVRGGSSPTPAGTTGTLGATRPGKRPRTPGGADPQNAGGSSGVEKAPSRTGGRRGRGRSGSTSLRANNDQSTRPQTVNPPAGPSNIAGPSQAAAQVKMIGRGQITSTHELNGQQPHIQNINSDVEGRIDHDVKGRNFASTSAHLDGGFTGSGFTQLSATGNKLIGANVCTGPNCQGLIQGNVAGREIETAVGPSSRVSSAIKSSSPGERDVIKVSLSGGQGSATAYAHSHRKRELGWM